MTKVKSYCIIIMLEFSNKNFLLFSMSTKQLTETLINLEIEGKINPYTLEVYENKALDEVSKLIISYANTTNSVNLKEIYVSLLNKINDEIANREADFTEAEDLDFQDTFIDDFIDTYA